ncbi:MAG: T9SS C-terminal target domain-containing protein [Bacteroidetes bacterium]|nr:MAG: T9SS C-terminal target domain-containing protein [Bacteroidota bacterium]
MKTKFLPFLLLVGSAAVAQKNDRVFAVTDQVKGAAGWNSIREALPQQDAEALLTSTLAKGVAISPQGKQVASYSQSNFGAQPMYTGVAALAFDADRNRLYFSTMMTQQLRYVNLGEPNVYHEVADLAPIFGNVAVSNQNQGSVVTRMTVADDGYGYGLSNDANGFFRFSLSKPGTVEQIGALIDAPENKAVSVHNLCSGWGGDMVAAATGELYLFTMKQEVFKIDPKSRVATHLGRLKGLPADFTINGAAVIGENEVVLSTAALVGQRALVTNMATLDAELQTNDGYYNASDLASGKTLFASKKTPRVIESIAPRQDNSGFVTIYPNPITNGKAVITFSTVKTGRFTIDLLSPSGNMVQRTAVTLTAEGQQVTLATNRLAKGFYTVRVVDANKRSQYAGKIIVQ